MQTILTILDFAAIIVQLIGSWIMFKNSPLNKPPGLILGPEGEEWIKQNQIVEQKNKNLKKGFLVLSIGFFISFISLFLKTICPN